MGQVKDLHAAFSVMASTFRSLVSGVVSFFSTVLTYEDQVGPHDVKEGLLILRAGVKKVRHGQPNTLR